MSTTRFWLIVIFAVAFISGCATTPPKPKLNPLQIQAMQTQEFKASKRQAFNAVITVLQNEGYTVKSANYKTGYITAKSATKDDPFITSAGTSTHLTTGEQVAIGLGIAALVVGAAVVAGGSGGHGCVGPSYRREEPTHTSYTVTVSSFLTRSKTKTTKIRLSFVQNKVISGRGAAKEDTQILDTSLYKKIFNEIRQQLFVAHALS